MLCPCFCQVMLTKYKISLRIVMYIVIVRFTVAFILYFRIYILTLQCRIL